MSFRSSESRWLKKVIEDLPPTRTYGENTARKLNPDVQDTLRAAAAADRELERRRISAEKAQEEDYLRMKVRALAKREFVADYERYHATHQRDLLRLFPRGDSVGVFVLADVRRIADITWATTGDEPTDTGAEACEFIAKYLESDKLTVQFRVREGGSLLRIINFDVVRPVGGGGRIWWSRGKGVAVEFRCDDDVTTVSLMMNVEKFRAGTDPDEVLLPPIRYRGVNLKGDIV
jgi:hypothetical protein